MSTTQQQHQRYDDEISLVDLAATFVKRRHIFYAVFLLCTLAGLAYALVTEETYQYTSLIQIAEKGSESHLEPPATTIATLESRWLPEQEVIYRAETDTRLPFKTSFSNPENTGLIRMVSESSQEHASDVKDVHHYLIEQVQQRHNALLTREQRSLESRIQSIDQSIDVLQNGQDTGQALAEAFERKTRLQSNLEALKATETLVLARQGADKTGPARSLIVILAAVLGLMGGVFLAFFTEFIVAVKSQLGADAE